jgi:hypothetical protein
MTQETIDRMGYDRVTVHIWNVRANTLVGVSMIMLQKCLMAALVLSAGAASPAASAANTTYNAVKQFSIKANPNQVWSYLYSGGILPDATNKANGVKGLIGWSNDGSYPSFVGVTANRTGMTQITNDGLVYYPTNYLELDGQSDSLGADVRFTAPSAGVYHITGNFEGCNLDEQTHPVVVEINKKVVFSATIDSFEVPAKFALKKTLRAKETVDFISQTGGNGTYLGTCLTAKVTGP